MCLAFLPLFAQDTMEEARAIGDYQLTMDRIARHFQVLIDLNHEMARDPVLRRRLGRLGELRLEEKIRNFETVPRAMAIARLHGISVRDIFMTEEALTSAMGEAAIEASAIKGQSTNRYSQMAAASAPPGHVKFYNDHKAEIAKLQAQLAGAGNDRQK